MNEKNIEIVLNHQGARVAYFEHDFPMFYCFHTGKTFAQFQEEWAEALQEDNDVMIIGFRGSAKTTIVRWFVVWCICYKKEPYIVVQSYEHVLSREWVREVAKLLMLPRICFDYGYLFPVSFSREDMAKSSMGSFESTNGVKIESKSLRQTLRWANTTDKQGTSTRPTLLILDDIDVEESVSNDSIIDDNEHKLISETFGALDPTRRKIIFLGNIIKEDGIVPRFEKKYKTSWTIFRQPLFIDGECVWPEVFTATVIEKLRNDGELAFNQNYLLIPYADGQTIIKRTSIKYAEKAPDGGRVVFGIDPAFSEKTNSDAMGLSIAKHITAEGKKQKYVLDMIEFRWDQKNEERFCEAVFELYKKHNCSSINIEANNGGEIIARMLKNKKMVVNVMKATKDKITRLREHEGSFERWEIYFLPGTEKGVEQLLKFPNVKNDDMVDSLVYALKEWPTSFMMAL